MGKRDDLKERIGRSKKGLRASEALTEELDKAQVILQEVAQLTQEELTYQIGELVSLALEGVFEDPYELSLDFVVKRGKTEAEITFKRDGEEMDPMGASGGGAVDIAAFALRVSLWCLQRPKTRNVILLDEPFRFLSRNLRPKAAEILTQLSSKLGIQFVMVTHDQDLIGSADKVFVVENKGGISQVVCQKEEA